MDELTDIRQVEQRMKEHQNTHNNEVVHMTKIRQDRNEKHRLHIEMQKQSAKEKIERARQALAAAEAVLPDIERADEMEQEVFKRRDEEEDKRIAESYRNISVELKARWAELAMPQYGSPFHDSILNSSVSRSATPQRNNSFATFTAVNVTNNNTEKSSAFKTSPSLVLGNSDSMIKVEKTLSAGSLGPELPSLSPQDNQGRNLPLENEPRNTLSNDSNAESLAAATLHQIQNSTRPEELISTPIISPTKDAYAENVGPRVIARLSSRPLALDIGKLEAEDSVIEYPLGSGNWYSLVCSECSMQFNSMRGASTHLRAAQKHCEMSQKKSSFQEALDSFGTKLTGTTKEALKAHDQKYASAWKKEEYWNDKDAQMPDKVKKEPDTKTAAPSNADLPNVSTPPVKRPMGPSRADPAYQRQFSDLALQKSIKKRVASDFVEGSPKRSKSHYRVPQRHSTTWFYKGLVIRPTPKWSPDSFPEWNEMQMFSGAFLTNVFNLPPNLPGGWVIPLQNDVNKKQIVPTKGPIWLAKVSTNPELPNKIGAHGLYYQFAPPQTASRIIPVFVSERVKDHESWWYCGHYGVEDAELSVPNSSDEKDSMRTLSRRWTRQLQKEAKKGRDPAKQFPWTREQILKLTEDDFYSAMLPRENNKPPIVLCYKRRLIFKWFDRDFYDQLVAEKAEWATEG